MFRRLSLAALIAACFAQQRPPDISYDAAAPLEFRETMVKDYGDARLLDVSYASPRGGRVTAYAIVPARPAHPAGIVWQHWGQGDRSSFLPEALALARKGAASILVNAPWLRAGAKPANTPEEELAQWLQSAVDIRRAADALVRQYGVQAARLGYVGHSYGATLGGVIAVGERRFRALVLMGGFASLSDAMLHPKQGPAPTGERTRKSAAALAAIDAERYIGQAAPAALLLQFARYDHFIDQRQADRYAAAASNPKDVRWYECGHEFNDPESARDREAFLDKALGLSAYVAAVRPPTARRP
jgi:dienelactone hydrolase